MLLILVYTLQWPILLTFDIIRRRTCSKLPALLFNCLHIVCISSESQIALQQCAEQIRREVGIGISVFVDFKEWVCDNKSALRSARLPGTRREQCSNDIGRSASFFKKPSEPIRFWLCWDVSKSERWSESERKERRSCKIVWEETNKSTQDKITALTSNRSLTTRWPTSKMESHGVAWEISKTR